MKVPNAQRCVPAVFEIRGFGLQESPELPKGISTAAG